MDDGVFDRNFQRAMRGGARLLFFIAVLVVLMGVINGVEQVAGAAGPGGRDKTTWLHHLTAFWSGLSVGWPRLITAILDGLAAAAWPLFGAIIVHRIDQWMSHRDS